MEGVGFLRVFVDQDDILRFVLNQTEIVQIIQEGKFLLHIY